jgi:hypothetical protein
MYIGRHLEAVNAHQPVAVIAVDHYFFQVVQVAAGHPTIQRDGLTSG